MKSHQGSVIKGVEVKVIKRMKGRARLLKREKKQQFKKKFPGRARVPIQDPALSPAKYFVYNLPKWDFRFLIEKVQVTFPLKSYHPSNQEENTEDAPPDLSTVFEQGLSSVRSSQTTLQKHSEQDDDESYKPSQEATQEEEKKLEPQIRKFYKQRHYLFARFDQGIKLDVESWYSVTPQEIAKYIANQCLGLRVFDGFSGAGGNLIQFAKVLEKLPLKENNYVLGSDISGIKSRLARKNAKVYEVSPDHIKILTSDFFKMTNQRLEKEGYQDGKVDVVFLSPPWGGPDYLQGKYKLSNMKPSFQKIMYHASLISTSVVLFLPRNLELKELLECVALQAFEQRDNEFWVRWEQIYRGSALKVNIFYLGRYLVDFTKEQLEYFDLH